MAHPIVDRRSERIRKYPKAIREAEEKLRQTILEAAKEIPDFKSLYISRKSEHD